MRYPGSNSRNCWAGRLQRMLLMGTILTYWLACTHTKVPEPEEVFVDYRDKWTGVYSGWAYYSSFLPKNGAYVYDYDTVQVLVTVEKYKPNPNILFTISSIDTPQFKYGPIGYLPIGEDGISKGRNPITHARFFAGDSLFCGQYNKHGIRFYSGYHILAKKL